MPSKEELILLLKKYGYNTVSFQSLMSGLSQFEVDSIEGFISYVKVGKVIIAFGDPICSEDKIYELTHEFRKFCKKQKSACCILSVSEKFKKKLEIMGFGNLKIGEEGIFNLSDYPPEGANMKDLRYYVNRAKKEGVVVRKLEKMDEDISLKLINMNIGWEKTRKVRKFSFLLSLNPLENFEEKLIFVAEKDEKVVGYICCVPIYGRKGFFFEDVINSKDSPVGTNRALIFEAIEYLKSNGLEMATLGTSPLGNVEVLDNPENKKITKLLEYIYDHVNGFYNFKGLHKFKESFNPNYWENKYFSYYPPKLKSRYLFAVIKAYSKGGVTRIVLSKIKKKILEIK